MARVRERITKTSFARLRQTPGVHADGDGLDLVTETPGVSSWRHRFTSPVTGKRREMGLGSAWHIDLAAAREAAAAARKLVKEGIDPLEARHAAKLARQLAAAQNITFQKYEHAVPLSTPALVILDKAKLLHPMGQPSGSDYVFPSPRRRHQPIGTAAITNMANRMRLGGRWGDFCPHGFRSTFVEWGKSRRTPEGLEIYNFELRQRALAHLIGNATQRSYDRSSELAARRPMMENWGVWCDWIMPEEPEASDNVVRLHRAG